MNSTHALEALPTATLYYDGECPFCRACARFIQRHDPRQLINLQPLQGSDQETATGCYETIIFIRGSYQSQFSDAVIDVLKTLGGGWWLLGVCLYVVPKFLRDALYRFVGNHRHWFAPFL